MTDQEFDEIMAEAAECRRRVSFPACSSADDDQYAQHAQHAEYGGSAH
ncbi:hypothetical protein [Streptomyces sp. A5-4]